MKVMVVGGTSTVSKYLLPKLEEFCHVITLGRTQCDIYCDIAQLETNWVIPSNNIDVVIHLASAFGDGNIENIIDTEITNVIGTAKMLNVAIKHGVKHYIYVSSIFSELPEDSPFYSAYSMSKKHSEDICLKIAEMSDMNLTILKPSQLFSKNEDCKKHQPFLYNIVESIANHQPVTLFGNTSPKRNYLSIEEFAHILSLTLKHGVYGTYQCQYPDNVSYLDIVNQAISDFDSHSKIIHDTERNNIPNNIFDYNDSLYSAINYYPKESLLNCLTQLITQENTK